VGSSYPCPSISLLPITADPLELSGSMRDGGKYIKKVIEVGDQVGVFFPGTARLYFNPGGPS